MTEEETVFYPLRLLYSPVLVDNVDAVKTLDVSACIIGVFVFTVLRTNELLSRIIAADLELKLPNMTYYPDLMPLENEEYFNH